MGCASGMSLHINKSAGSQGGNKSGMQRRKAIKRGACKNLQQGGKLGAFLDYRRTKGSSLSHLCSH